MDPSSSAAPPPNVEPSEKATTAKPKKRWDSKTINGHTYEFPAGKQIYYAHGKWAWANCHDILSDDPGTSLGYGLEGQAVLKVGVIDDRQVVYISKLSSVWDSFKTFFSSLYLNASSKYLRPLQGDCIPWVIGVRHCVGGRIGVAQDLPHPTGWREADMFLEESQKEAIIAAYQKLHDRGILHGDAEYRHWLIGDDGKVTIIDFGLSKVVNLGEGARTAGVERCSPMELRTEMRKVKFMLDWKTSRETEFRLTKLRTARDAKDTRNREVADEALRNQADPFERAEGSIAKIEPISEEEAKKNPDGGIKAVELANWTYGDHWGAHRYEVKRYANKAVLNKTPIPRPPIPGQDTTTESTNPVASESISVPAHVPAIQPASTDSTGELDAPTPTGSSSEESAPEAGPEKGPEEQKERKIRKLERSQAMIFDHPRADDSDGLAQTRFSSEDPEDMKNVCMKRMETPPLRDGEAHHVVKLAKKRSFEEESETEPEVQNNLSAEHTMAVLLRQDKAEHDSEPARKRQRITGSAPVAAARSPSPAPSVATEVFDSDGSTGSTASPGEDDIMKMPLLADDAADPTPYELNPEACAFLRAEAARGFSRFTAANMRVQPLQTQLDQENHNLEQRRSEMLRLMLMLPREDRTILWTNMGQPDARSLLGLLHPEAPGPSKTTRNFIHTQARSARTGHGNRRRTPGFSKPSRESDPGFLALQKAQANTGSKQKLSDRLRIAQEKDSLAMPPPPLPVRVASLQRNTSQMAGSSKPTASTSRGPTRSGSTIAAKSGLSAREQHAYLKKAMDETRKAYPNGVFSVSVPREILALEGKSTRKYPTPPHSVDSPNPPPYYNTEGFEDMISQARARITKAAKQSDAKRKREDTEDSRTLPETTGGEGPDAKRKRGNTEDSKTLPGTGGEGSNAKRRKTENCDLV